MEQSSPSHCPLSEDDEIYTVSTIQQYVHFKVQSFKYKYAYAIFMIFDIDLDYIIIVSSDSVNLMITFLPILAAVQCSYFIRPETEND